MRIALPLLIIEGLGESIFLSVLNSEAISNIHLLITADEFKTFQRVSSTNSEILLTLVVTHLVNETRCSGLVGKLACFSPFNLTKGLS